jgi:hypothetical protein
MALGEGQCANATNGQVMMVNGVDTLDLAISRLNDTGIPEIGIPLRKSFA